MKRRLNCPGSDNLIASLPVTESQPNRYAAEGTVAHTIGELCLRNGEEPSDYFGKKFKEDGFTFTCDQNMVDAVTVYTDTVRQIIAEEEAWGFNVQILVEFWGSLKHLNVEGMEGGTSDLVLTIWDGEILERIYVIDYKHGQGVEVFAEENDQALCYAEAVRNGLKEKGHIIPEEVEIIIAICQPRIRSSNPVFKTWNITGLELDQYIKNKLVPGVLLSWQEDAPLTPGDEQCRFCDAKAVCPALNELTQEVAISEFKDLVMPAPNTLTKEQIKRIMDHADLIRSFIVAVEKYANELVNKGEQIEGYKLVRKTTHRKLTDDALDPMLSDLYLFLDETEVFEKRMKTITDLTKALERKFGKAKAKEVMDSITYKPEGEIVIAPEKDKRNGIKPSAETDFESYVD